MRSIEDRIPSAGEVPASKRFTAAQTAARCAIAGGPQIGVKPAVSVIVPVRNRKEMLAETVASLFAQDLSEPYEVIIVDNASDDGTAGYLRRLVSDSELPVRVVTLEQDQGPAFARNVGVVLATGDILAFTDSDCIPTSRWLLALLRSFQTGTGVVQGATMAVPWQRQPLFNHFIETKREDGSYSTSNVAYRREAVLAAGGFDPACRYWEDVDLGWRVKRLGWSSGFAHDALVYHQVIKLSALGWLRHAFKFHNWPAKASRYPEFRQHLFMRVWVQPFHLLFQAFVLGLAVGPRRPISLLLCVPYAVAFVRRRKLSGRWPALKYAAYFAHDCVAFAALVFGSVRFRSPVL